MSLLSIWCHRLKINSTYTIALRLLRDFFSFEGFFFFFHHRFNLVLGQFCIKWFKVHPYRSCDEGVFLFSPPVSGHLTDNLICKSVLLLSNFRPLPIAIVIEFYHLLWLYWIIPDLNIKIEINCFWQVNTFLT
jgi:hypothetical protein